jgi:hypothetical protein
MPRSYLDDPNHWRYRADEARLMADNMADPESKRMMMEVATGYERLAERAKERAALSNGAY